MKQVTEQPVPAIVEFITFWCGSEKTNWREIQNEWGLTDEQIQRLQHDNKVYREARPL